MIGQSSSYAEIVVKISPARMWSSGSVKLTEDVSSRLSEAKRSYDALIYTKLEIPRLERPTAPPPGQPGEIAQLPLAGKETLTVRWSRYQEYLAAFVEGEKRPSYMRERLLETMPDGLESIFSEPLPTSQPVRLWWASDTPELEDLPWELVSYRSRNDPERFSFVRGLPPENPLPILPIGERLRLAFIHDPSYTPQPLQDALKNLTGNIEVIDFPDFPRKALEQVTKEGYELVHLVADGVVSSAYEGILYFHGGRSTSPKLSPGELSSILRGSRVSMLTLSEQQHKSPDVIDIGGQLVPSVYRAFAYLASSRLPLPTMVVPLGPLEPSDMHEFWNKFYNNLGESLSVQRAIARARIRNYPAPAGLFLRHLHEVLFRRQSATAKSSQADPNAIGTELQLSHDVVEQLKAHSELYGPLPESVSKFIESESVRQGNLEAELDPWLTPEEGELNR